MPDLLPAQERPARDGVRGGDPRAGKDPPDLLRQFRGDPLVAVDVEHDVVGGQFHCRLLLRAESFPRDVEHIVRVPPADLRRPVGAPGVDDHDLVGPTERFEARGDLLPLVEGDDDRGDPAARGGVHVLFPSVDRRTSRSCRASCTFRRADPASIAFRRNRGYSARTASTAEWIEAGEGSSSATPAPNRRAARAIHVPAVAITGAPATSASSVTPLIRSAKSSREYGCSTIAPSNIARYSVSPRVSGRIVSMAADDFLSRSNSAGIPSSNLP